MAGTPAQLLLRWAGTRIGMAEARTLLAFAAECDFTALWLLDGVPAHQESRFRDLVSRRETGIPIQHLTGEAFFRTVRVRVGSGVFIPRPETETMVEWALGKLDEGARVVELGAGSGAISLALAVEGPHLDLHAVELSPQAFGYAQSNLAGTGVDLVLGDMAAAFRELDGTVDLVISNPPYIPLDAYETVAAEVRNHEPPLALFAGADGLSSLREVARVAARLLVPGGWVCAEHAEVQEESAPAVFVDQGGFDLVRDHHDLNSRPRFVTARRASASKSSILAG